MAQLLATVKRFDMQLIKSAKPSAIAQNIREMKKAGYPQKRAVAAALRTADEAKKRAATGKGS